MMTTKFQSYEAPVAYAMMAAAKRIRPRRDGQHAYEQYFLYWTAFNNIYTTIAEREGLRTRLKRAQDGSIVTRANGSVRVPEVEVVSEDEQIELALGEFGDGLKHKLIVHEGTAFFARRIPYWQGLVIETDAMGQRVNGVIQISHTSEKEHPVWSPIDVTVYEGYLADPDNEESREFLAGQIVDVLHTVRKNFMHASRKFDDANDLKVVGHGLPMLETIVRAFTR